MDESEQRKVEAEIEELSQAHQAAFDEAQKFVTKWFITPGNPEISSTVCQSLINALVPHIIAWKSGSAVQ
jgi:hypothetical protein